MRSLLLTLRHKRVTFFLLQQTCLDPESLPRPFWFGFYAYLSLLTDVSILGVTVTWNKNINQKGSHVCVIINLLSWRAKRLLFIVGLSSNSQSYLVATLSFYAATFLPLAVFIY